MRIYRILARLLDYPDAELMDGIPEIVRALKIDSSINAQERTFLQRLVSWMQLHDLTGLQAEYVQTFDMTQEHDLRLTRHLFGDDRGRGPALIDLSEYYKGSNLEMKARVFLGDAAKVLKTLADNLEKAGSPYAKLLRIIENRGHLAQAA